MRLSSFRPLFAVLALAATVAMVASVADARPRSSFGSRGSQTYSAPPSTTTAPKATRPMERSMTQPGQPGSTASRTATAPAAGGGFFNRPGFMGGLFAGFLGAGLLGMLFGNGLTGGLGGMASMLGLHHADRHHRADRLSGLDLVAAPEPAGACERPSDARLRPQRSQQSDRNDNVRPMMGGLGGALGGGLGSLAARARRRSVRPAPTRSA